MRRASLLALAVVPLLAGCYRVTVVTGAPASNVTVDKPWQHSFIGGLVPPTELNVREQCPNGVARVMTERTFVNEVASFVTSGIYSPMRALIVCASGPVPR
jgi:hypothetical protein